MNDLSNTLKKFDSGLVSDALDKLGMKGAVAGLSQLTVCRPIAGRVITVKLRPPKPNEAPTRHLGAGAIVAASAGDIIVVEHDGRMDCAGWGGLLARGAAHKNIGGIIVDGAVRDVDECATFDMPVFARGATPMTARGRAIEHSFNEPICIAGITVSPGDLVLADGTGVVFLAAAEAVRILDVAEQLYNREEALGREIDSGRPIDAVMNTKYEDMLKSEADA